MFWFVVQPVTITAAAGYGIARPDVADELIADKLVVINFTTGKYHGVRGSGIGVWQLLDDGHTVAEVLTQFRKVCSDFDSSAAEAIVQFIAELERQELITRTAQRSGAPSRGLQMSGPFRAPELETRDDLKDHLALDPIPRRGRVRLARHPALGGLGSLGCELARRGLPVGV